MTFVRIPPEDRYWGFVDKAGPDECWLWNSTRNRHGYATMSIAGRKLAVQRWAYRQYIGPLEVGEVVRHTCDNPPCHNHAHWIKGTQADNVRDMIERGRRFSPHHEGEGNPNSRISDEQVREIRQRKADGALLREIAPDYGISLVMVSKIVRREAWAHVE